MNLNWIKHNDSMTLIDESAHFQRIVERYLSRIEANSPFYRQRIQKAKGSNALEILAQLPISSKQDYRDALQHEALRALQDAPFISDYSSGSTDSCVLRFSSPREELAELAITEQVFRRAGMLPSDRFACLEVGAAEIYDFYCRAARNIGATQTSYLKVTNDYASSFEPLQRLNPQVILTLPSLLIKAWPAMKTFWPHGQSPIKSFIHMGEPMHPEFKQEVMDVLGCKVYSFYGTTELGGMGGECSEGCGCHFDPALICPTLDNAKEVAPNVYEGEGFFTTLHFQHQTVVKYRVGDLVRIDLNPCPCGEQTPRLVFIERTNDSFIITGDKFRYDLIHTALRKVVPQLDLMTIRISDMEHSTKSLITLILPEALQPHEAILLETLHSGIFELDSVYHYGFADFALEFIPLQQFGDRKTKRVIDERKYFL